MLKITTLMFHHITPKKTAHAVSPVTFKSYLVALKEAGFQFISINEFEKNRLKNLNENKKYIAITFDDGWLDNWIYAFPILKELNIPASLFLVSSWPNNGVIRNLKDTQYLATLSHSQSMELVESEQSDQVAMRWQELLSMQNSGLISVHCHSHLHGDNWTDLKHDNQEIYKDILLSKKIIEEKLFTPSSHFCWPRGRFTPDLFKQVQALGFDFQYSTLKGNNCGYSLSKKIIRRINVTEKSTQRLVNEVILYQSPFIAQLLTILHKFKLINRLRMSTPIGKLTKWITI